MSDAWAARGPVVCDMAVAGYWVGGYASFSDTRRLQYPVGWGTLGYALPASVGAAAAGVGPVLVVCGDGGAAMAVGELATLVQERLPVTVLVVDDGGYGMLRFDQQVAGDAERGVDLVGPDWVALAGAYGIACGGRDRPRCRAARGAGPCGATRAQPRLVLLRAALYPPRTTSPRWSELGSRQPAADSLRGWWRGCCRSRRGRAARSPTGAPAPATSWSSRPRCCGR